MSKESQTPTGEEAAASGAGFNAQAVAEKAIETFGSLSEKSLDLTKLLFETVFNVLSSDIFLNLFALGITILCVGAFLRGVKWVFDNYYKVGKPNMWTIVIRDGEMVNCGVGLATWQWPWSGDVIVSYPSKLHEIKFMAQ